MKEKLSFSKHAQIRFFARTTIGVGIVPAYGSRTETSRGVKRSTMQFINDKRFALLRAGCQLPVLDSFLVSHAISETTALRLE